jgi:IS4 transposase
VHRETLEVYNVGTASVLYSTMQEPAVGQVVAPQKVLLCSEVGRGLEDIIELYDLRWQIELFFKECKSTLGLGRYRLGNFAAVEGWVNLCVLAFLYLEWYRQQALGESAKDPAEHKRWSWQRAFGLCAAVRQDVEQQDLLALLELLGQPGGLAQVQDLLRRAVQKEYRKAA